MSTCSRYIQYISHVVCTLSYIVVCEMYVRLHAPSSTPAENHAHGAPDQHAEAHANRFKDRHHAHVSWKEIAKSVITKRVNEAQ